jgi:hypothetical protein
VEPISTSAAPTLPLPGDGPIAAPGALSRLRPTAVWLLGNSPGIVVAGAIVYCQCISMQAMYWIRASRYFGWPFVLFVAHSPNDPLSWRDFAPIGALANVLFAAAVTAGTIAVFGRCRGSKRFQWKLSAWFVLVAIFAVSLNAESWVTWVLNREPWRTVGLHPNPWGPAKVAAIAIARTPPAIVKCLILFGVTCTLFAVVLSLARLVPRRGR